MGKDFRSWLWGYHLGGVQCLWFLGGHRGIVFVQFHWLRWMMKKTKGGLLWPSLQRFCGLLWQLSLLKYSEARAPEILLFSPFTCRTQFLFRGYLLASGLACWHSECQQNWALGRRAVWNYHNAWILGHKCTWVACCQYLRCDYIYCGTRVLCSGVLCSDLAPGGGIHL